ncbi:unnamed protein product [Vicia faba]|uniref:65-kDa microtubule-associated protein 3 n=1 Tax=Vicia faba TaxID=3906 RepID=A0AAV0YGT8_VICFA|nr:unnamed protein product [Vicia faba]
MSQPHNDHLLPQAETTCGLLIQELQTIWHEVGESQSEKDRMLFELEQECLEVYRKNIDKANCSRAQVRQEIADSEAKLTAICSAMGERPVHIRQSDHKATSLKEELAVILPELEEMQKRKLERRNQFIDVQEQIQSVSNEIYGPREIVPFIVDETDLSLRKLEELHRQLHTLQKEKSDRLQKVQDNLCSLRSLCSVLGLDFTQTVSEVHPSLGHSEGSKSVNNDTISQLALATQELRGVKLHRMQKLQDLATSMLELWHLMDTPIEEQQVFQNVTCNIAASEDEVTESNSLSEDFINHVEAEVSRLEDLKSSKMKELVFKKRAELEEICRKTHLVPEFDGAVEHAIEAIESGSVDLACHVTKRAWLEEYSRDENRYNAGKGTHLNLKRAEKARVLVNKIPAMTDTLTSKTVAWEKDKGTEFIYDGVRLTSMLEDYILLRQAKEQERRRQRDLKKLQGQIIAEQEVLYGSKSPSKALSARKAPRTPNGSAASRRVTFGGSTLKPDSKLTHSSSIKKTNRMHQIEQTNDLDDSMSCLSSARRGLDIADIPKRKYTFGTGIVRDIESPLTRQPFTTISSTVSSQENVESASVELNMQKLKLQETLAINNFPFTSTSKTDTVVDEESRTPKAMPIPSSHSTPMTVPIPMNMAMTPAPFGGELVPEIEYSFEEKRLGFLLA